MLPVETVFDVIAEPYLGRNTHAMAEKLRVVERGSDMVLAEHYTAVGSKRAVTLETVGFERPHLVSFRLVRGPVPEVTETFFLSGERGITTLRYEGALGTDGGRLGAKWGALVAKRWEEAVEQAMVSVKKDPNAGQVAVPAPGPSAALPKRSREGNPAWEWIGPIETRFSSSTRRASAPSAKRWSIGGTSDVGLLIDHPFPTYQSHAATGSGS